MSSLPFASLIIYLEGVHPQIIIHHSADKERSTSPVRWVDAGDIISHVPVEIEANLRWNLGSTLVVSGRLISDEPTEMKVCLLSMGKGKSWTDLTQVARLVVTLSLNAWELEIPLEPCAGREGKSTSGKWLSSSDPPRFTNVKREHYWSTM